MMLLHDDEGPNDWEIKDEEPPEILKRKWEREEVLGARTVVCPSCKKETSSGNLTCVFCGATLTQERCPGDGFFPWIKRLFKKS